MEHWLHKYLNYWRRSSGDREISDELKWVHSYGRHLHIQYFFVDFIKVFPLISDEKSIALNCSWLLDCLLSADYSSIHLPTYYILIECKHEHSIISFVELGHFQLLPHSTSARCGRLQMSLFNLISTQFSGTRRDIECEVIFLDRKTHPLGHSLPILHLRRKCEMSKIYTHEKRKKKNIQYTVVNADVWHRLVATYVNSILLSIRSL